MSKTAIKVVYNCGGINSKLDKLISKAMKSIGADWYAQGVEVATLKRDLNFDIEVPAK